MKKAVLTNLIIKLAIFLPLFLVANFAGGNDGLGLLLLLFFIVYPIFSAASGVLAGLNIKNAWYIPIALFVVFLFSAWISLETISPDFLIYSAFYLIISAAAMLITFGIRKLKR